MAISITPKLIMEAAQRRGWEIAIIDESRALYSISVPEKGTFYVRNINSFKSGMVNRIIADNKEIFARIAASMGVRMPEEQVYSNLESARQFLETHKQIVVKPTDQAHGDGVTVGIVTMAELEAAVSHAQKFSKTLLLQQHIEGDDYRLLMIDNKLAAAAIRKPAFVVGDGAHTVEQLIEIENTNPERTDGYKTKLVTIDVEDAKRFLGSASRTIPGVGEECQVVGTANIGKGGVSIDVTDTINSTILEIATKLTKHLRFGLCGVDFLVSDKGDAFLLEINSGPSLGLHELPWRGQARGTPDKFLDWLTKD